MTLIDLLTALRNRWKIAVAIFLAVMAATVGLTLLQQPSYQASSRVLIAPAPSNDADTLNRRLQYLQGSLGTYSELVSSEVVATRVADNLDSESLTPDQIKKQISGKHEVEVNLVQIDAEGSSPAQAAKLANTTADVLGQVIERPEPTDEGAEVPVSVITVDNAKEPTSPVSPRWPVNLLVGGVLALVISISAAVLLHFQQLSRTRRSGH